jgi:lipopolysaccharide transport system ATP-binding protein
MEGVLKKSYAALAIGFALYDEDANLLFWSYHTDASEGQWPRLRPGPFALSATLPSRLLNEGTYRIECIAGIPHHAWLLEPGGSAPAVFLTIRGGLSDSPYWMARRPGILAPVLEWAAEGR